MRFKERADRRSFVGGSDARIIMGAEEGAAAPLEGKAGRGRARGFIG
jgi:hypothetical protein